jgi:hypothetical protein
MSRPNERGDEVAAYECAGLCWLRFGRANTVTIEVANGIATNGNAVLAENNSMLAIAMAPPAAPASMARS